LRENLVCRLATSWSEQRAFTVAYLACTLGLFLTSLSSTVIFCLAGYGVSSVLLVVDVVLRRRFLHSRRIFAALQLALITLGLSYLLAKFPEGKFTALVFMTSALMISAAPNPLRLPRVSHWLIAFTLVWVYGNLALGAEGLDNVLAHSKNYVGIFLLFLVTLHIIEFQLDSRRPIWWLVIAATMVNVVTLSLANIVAASLIAGFAFIYGGWSARIGTLTAALVILGIATGGGTVRDNILVFHLSGSNFSSSDLKSITQVYAHSLSAEVKIKSSSSRVSVWIDYVESLDTSHVILGSWLTRPIDGLTLHNSTLMLHAKFGILGLGLMLIYSILFLRYGLALTPSGLLTGIFLIRAQADTTALAGTYFDYAVYAALPLAALALAESGICVRSPKSPSFAEAKSGAARR